jgi:hypothetical protein
VDRSRAHGRKVHRRPVRPPARQLRDLLPRGQPARPARLGGRPLEHADVQVGRHPHPPALAGALAGGAGEDSRRFLVGAGSSDARLRRRTKAPAILDELRAWLWSQAEITSLSIGKAAAYAIGIWDRLTRFVDDARIPLDNNATERAIRGPVVGRKNHYGSKSRSGTEVASRLYSILETCKLHGVDPATYLHAAVTAADRGELILPWSIATAK